MTTPRVTRNTLVTPFHVVAAGAAGAATSVATPASAGLTTYITDVTIALGAVAATVVTTLTISNALGAGVSLRINETVGATVFVYLHYADGLPANAVNTAMTVAIAVIASGGTVDIDVYGFQQ